MVGVFHAPDPPSAGDPPRRCVQATGGIRGVVAMAAANKGYRGYVTSRPFGGYVIPVPVQSLVLRDYCQRKGYVYVLPVNENSFPHSYLVLEGMIQNLSDFSGVLMCSMHMLPQLSARRRAIFGTILRQGGSVEGARAVFHRAREAGGRAVVFTSSMSVYGRIDAPVVPEDLAPVDVDSYGRSKSEGERLLRAAVDEGLGSALSIRLPGTVGRGS